MTKYSSHVISCYMSIAHLCRSSSLSRLGKLPVFFILRGIWHLVYLSGLSGIDNNR